MFFCVEMIVNVVYDFNGKMIKNCSELKVYMEDLKFFLLRLLFVIYVNFVVFDKVFFFVFFFIVGEF